VSVPAVLDPETLWAASLSDVTRDVRSPAQLRWLSATRPVGFSDDTLILAAPHTFAREWLHTRCGDHLRQALTRAAGRPLDVLITVQPNPEPIDGDAVSSQLEPPEADGGSQPADHPSGDAHPDLAPTNGDDTAHLRPLDDHDIHGRSFGGNGDVPVGPAIRIPELTPDERPHADAQPHDPTEIRPLQAPGRPPGPTVTLPPSEQRDNDDGGGTLNPKYVFDNFVIGPSNRFAHAAAFAVAEAPARAYNPLFIYGGAGLGKTHLLHAVGHYVRSLYPRLRVRYVTTEQFTNEFIASVQQRTNSAFQRRYRQADILLVDDIQFLERAERTQEEFFHTFNALHNAEKQIVISSDRQPRKIAHLEDRLRSRFEWGLITDVQPPDLETRIAILNKKASYESLPVPPEVLELIASWVQSNIRELEGALIRVTAFASLQGVPVDRDLAETVLKDLLPDEGAREISLQLIQNEVADYFELTIDDLCSPSRAKQLVTARQIAMFLIRELTDLSLPRIGKAFGGRDHTTVMHAERKIAGLMQERRAIYDQVQELTGRIRAQARR
jgi:chromosomal replication initiator protein